MTFFSRLTDIVTCNLSSILSKCEDPKAALEQVLQEMDQGLAGAKRSVETAARNVDQIRENQLEQQKLADFWLSEAKSSLKNASDDQARHLLLRRKEALALVAGLEQQLQSAVATHEHLLTMKKALEARKSEALRKHDELACGVVSSSPAIQARIDISKSTISDQSEWDELEAELQALKKEMENG